MLRRYFRGPHVSWAQAVHPVADDEHGLRVWLPAGAGFACRVGPLVSGAPSIEDYGAAPLERRTWTDRDVLILHPPGASHSVWWFFREQRFLGWYVNLEAVIARHPGGIDVVDHHLDVVVDPDRSWRWKDEDTFAASTDRPGFWNTAEASAIRAEGQRVAAAAEAGRFPFDGTWCDFRPDPAWPLPQLPHSTTI
ncbi:DUF402 domain-containing protein [Dactylosporangium sp. CS-047395]|uniref:DUF402 domain-containing protein n=1 Tax=Dactylosporangium sp. CS-047395 TaxID=3239936 RepID=UPI003D8F5C7C